MIAEIATVMGIVTVVLVIICILLNVALGDETNRREMYSLVIALLFGLGCVVLSTGLITFGLKPFLQQLGIH